MNNLKIIAPDMSALDFIIGCSKIVEYTVTNKSDFKIKELTFDVETILKDRDGAIVKTVEKYAKIISSPKVIYPGKTAVVKVDVTVPEDYNEQVTKDDGDKIKAPFRIKLKASGLEFIEEI